MHTLPYPGVVKLGGTAALGASAVHWLPAGCPEKEASHPSLCVPYPVAGSLQTALVRTRRRAHTQTRARTASPGPAGRRSRRRCGQRCLAGGQLTLNKSATMP